LAADRSYNEFRSVLTSLRSGPARSSRKKSRVSCGMLFRALLELSLCRKESSVLAHFLSWFSAVRPVPASCALPHCFFAFCTDLSEPSLNRPRSVAAVTVSMSASIRHMMESKVASTMHPPRSVVVVVDDVVVVVPGPPKASLAASTTPTPVATVHRERIRIIWRDLCPQCVMVNATKVLGAAIFVCGAGRPGVPQSRRRRLVSIDRDRSGEQ